MYASVAFPSVLSALPGTERLNNMRIYGFAGAHHRLAGVVVAFN
ncbi:uncharacterized protein ANIA_11372 [Aspergillus nidulans FGSC A4]|uniref:Uncharacterized protein n=1 Tax=Emericella nidulans (strain FGSC A4 / ATCC 38163 / CBS 112.46 / NRRL 194 / M139) TaxID=227321 RepID=C8VJ71_EMENI|nr:hypothetical protein [Aspergillus nidulans FGSC A4]CBF83764.1 TPA: hypothetical protein ANIA_11372 [Aspergillus nidulans FGSC A4]